MESLFIPMTIKTELLSGLLVRNWLNQKTMYDIVSRINGIINSNNPNSDVNKMEVSRRILARKFLYLSHQSIISMGTRIKARRTAPQ